MSLCQPELNYVRDTRCRVEEVAHRLQKMGDLPGTRMKEYLPGTMAIDNMANHAEGVMLTIIMIFYFLKKYKEISIEYFIIWRGK